MRGSIFAWPTQLVHSSSVALRFEIFLAAFTSAILAVKLSGLRLPSSTTVSTPEASSRSAMYDKAVYIVTTTRNASISWVQRQLRIGYNRAARLVEEMEKQGVVSPPDHTNKREVLVAAA